MILMNMKIWEVILIPVVSLIVGLIVGFFVARYVFKKYLKKNPPINENMIRAMFAQMGRTASEKQIRAVMKSMNDAK